jgi:adenosylhomocysteinase
MKFKVKDIGLAKQGRNQIDLAESQMPVLMKIKAKFEKEKPFAGKTIAACLHITKETAVLLKALQAGGAKVAACGSNPLSTQDDVSAALADEGINMFAWRGITQDKYYWCLEKVLDFHPDLVIDDGMDLIFALHTKRKNQLKEVIAGQEETTTGVIRLKAMEKQGKLRLPVVAVNDTPTKHMFDNYYGTGQSTLDALLRATNILLSGKTLVVAGYGFCSKGIAQRAHGLGARIIVTEIDPLKALQAAMDGFEVKPMKEAAKEADVILTATGNRDIVSKEHFSLLKDGCILGNSGHFNVEVNAKELDKAAKSKKIVRPNLEEFTLKNGNRVYLIGEGRLMNLAAAEGHPSAVMDLSFADQALTAEWLFSNYQALDKKVYDVPAEIDAEVAKLKLASMNIKIDTLTPVQKKYLSSWNEGT